MLPSAAADAKPPLLVVGALADVVEDQTARLFDALGVAPVRFLPMRRAADLPPIGPKTSYLLAQPFLGDTARALEERGARRIDAPFPLGAEGTTAWLRAAADAFGVAPDRFETATGRGRARAAQGCRALPADARGQKRLSLSRLAARNSAGAVPLAGTRDGRDRSRELPISIANIWPRNSTLLPPGVRLSEGQHVENQLDRCRADRPDLVVCGLGLANPLEAEGITTKWSIELMFTPIQGYDQAGDLAELFARPLVRRARLEV